jgi:hypothetical protein
MPQSSTSVALSRPASFIGGVASLGSVTYVVIAAPSDHATELIALRRRGDAGQLVGALPLDGVLDVTACGGALRIAGGFAGGGLGAIAVSADGRVLARRQLAAGPGVALPVIPLCLGGRATLLWREAAAPARLIATRVDDGDRQIALDDPEMIQLAAAAAAGQVLVLVQHRDGLHARAGGGPAHTVVEASAAMPALCASATGGAAAWTEQHLTTIRARRLHADGRPAAASVDVARVLAGEEVRSLHLACGAGVRFAVLWQTVSTITDHLPGDRTTTRLWIAFGDASGVRAPIELTDGGPGAAAWRGDELVVVHGEGTPRVATLTWPG